jgi:hypothetical protein
MVFPSGAFVIEHTGHSYLGFIGGTTPPTLAAGVSGYSLNFIGASSNAVMLANNTSAFDFLDYTWLAWIKTADAGSGRRRVVNMQESGGGDYIILALNGNVLECGDQISGVLTTKGSAINDGNWHQIGIRRRNGQDITWWLDGLEIGTQSIVSTSTHNFSVELWVGGYQHGTTETYSGLIGEIRIHNIALSAGQIYAAWHPSTRFELYGPPMGVSMAVGAAGGGATRSQVIVIG